MCSFSPKQAFIGKGLSKGRQIQVDRLEEDIRGMDKY